MKHGSSNYRFDLRTGGSRFYVGIYNAPRLKVLLEALRPGTGLVLTLAGHGVPMEFASPASALQWMGRQDGTIAEGQGKAA